PEERQKSCMFSGKFDEERSTCKTTWWTRIQAEELVGEGSTCRIRNGHGTDFVKCVSGSWTRSRETTTLGRHQETASQGGLTLWNIRMRGIWAGIGLMVTNANSTSTSQCSVIPYRRFPTVNGAAPVATISPVTSVLIHVTKDIAWSGQALCIVSSLGRAWFGVLKAQHATADLDLDLGQPLPKYVSDSKVGIVGARISMVKVPALGRAMQVHKEDLNGSPYCQKNVSSVSPTIGGEFHDCQGTVPIPKTRLADGERPTHCSQSHHCVTQPLQLSTRLTRSPEVNIHVDGWKDPTYHGIASQIAMYKLELHEVDVHSTQLSVKESALKNFTTEWPETGGPYDVHFQLPELDAVRLYAIILEVHDNAGNVGYARRLVLYDNSSTVEVATPLKVTSANPRTSYKWQTNVSSKDICLSWNGTFYNSALIQNNFLKPVASDTARGITGTYDQTTGPLPVSGTDNSNGIVKFELAYKVGQGSATGFTSLADTHSQTRCYGTTLTDGQTYTSFIRATDIMGNSRTESVIVSIDHTGPDVSMEGLRGTFGRDGLYVHNNTDLSTMVLVVHASDPHSGVKTLTWIIGTKDGSDDVGRGAAAVQRLNDTDCSGDEHCYCPSVGVCERNRYLVEFTNLVQSNSNQGLHHREYYFVINVTNHAELRTTKHLDILVDESPPIPGVVFEGLEDTDQAEMDFTSSDVIHVRWHGFADHESGILFYRVAIADRCMSEDEMNEAHNATDVESGTTVTLRFPKEGHYVSSVVAYNGGMQPSAVVCSDGITFDRTAPSLLNISITHARRAQAIGCTHQNQPWLINSNLTRSKLSPTKECSQLCSTASRVDHLPLAENVSLDDELSTDLCLRLPPTGTKDFILLPSDYLLLSWIAQDDESEMEEYYVGMGRDRTTSSAPDLLPFTPTHGHHSYHARHSGLGHGAVFFIFLKALSKAGLQVNLTLGPVIIDVTPPEVIQPLTSVVKDGFVLATWTNSTFRDPEQPSGVEFEFAFRLGFRENFVTPFLTLPEAVFHHCQTDSVTGCARYPVSALQSHDTEEGRLFFFQLHVTNAAGHVTSVNSSSVRLPAHAPPNHAVVMDVVKRPGDISPTRSTSSALGIRESATPLPVDKTDDTPSPLRKETETEYEYSKDIDTIVQRDTVCIAWSGFYHSDEITVEVGVGTTSEQDDIVSFFTITDNSNPVCVNASYIPFYTRVFSLVRATDTGGTTVVSSDGFRVIPNHDTENRLMVFNGKGCSVKDRLGSLNVMTGRNTTDLNLTPSAPVEHGDLLFVTFTPFVENVTFENAVLIKTTLEGYQIIAKSTDVRARIPPGATTDETADIFSCLKDAVLLPNSEDHVTVTWEVSGPWTGKMKSFKVSLTDETCLERAPKKEKYRQLQCLLAEKSVRYPETKLNFYGVAVFPGHAYTSSVSACFDDACLLAGTPESVFYEDNERSLAFDKAVIHSQSSEQVEAEFKLSILPPFNASSKLRDAGCVFQWALSKDRSGSTPVSEWRIVQAGNCSILQARDTFQVSKGSMYACVQPLYPWRAENPECRILERHASSHQSDIFNIIELSYSTIQENNLDGHLSSQHLGSNLQYLYDLDIDFAESDIMLAAVLTNSADKNVQWFLMTKCHVPADGNCASDPACVTTQTSDDGKVVFPRDQSKFKDGHVYYACAIVSSTTDEGVLRRSSEVKVEVCGNGVVVDDTPPAGGSVTIYNSDTGYLADNGHMLVIWRGFSDVETKLSTLLDKVTLNYSVALGSYPGAEDLARLVSVGQRTTWTFDHLDIVSGSKCVATVKAIIIDNTPPKVGHVWAGAITQEKFLPREDLPVHWDGVEDVESGVISLDVAIFSEGGQYMVMPFERCQDDSVLLSGTSELVDGHTYVALLKVTNGAGLVTLAQSEAFVVDGSPPDLGAVFNGDSSTTDHTIYSSELGVYRVSWSGFSDSHSGLDNYRVGLGSQPRESDIEPFIYVGLQTSFVWKRDFEQGKKYYVTVEACNKAGVCGVASSSSMIFDNSPPTAGHVTVGFDGHHSRFLGHNSSLPVQWIGFSDPQTDIQDFSWCVGRAPEKCDVIPFTQTMLSRATLSTGVTLPTATPLYVTVRAKNPLGMTAVGTSDSFKVDVTPPEMVTAPCFVNPHDGKPMDRNYDRSVMRLQWKFRDPDSSVVSNTVNIRSQLTGRLVADPITVTDGSGITVLLDEDHLLTDGDNYWATVTACNGAGLCSTKSSHMLLIDSTPPTVGSFESPLKWFKTRAISNTRTHINISWQGFTDAESDIDKYYLSMGKVMNGEELSNGVLKYPHANHTRTQRATLQTDQELRSGETIYMNLWAENILGLRSPISRMEFAVLFNDTSGKAGSLISVRYACKALYCTGECTCAAAGTNCQGNRTSCQDLQQNDPTLHGFEVVPHIGLRNGPQPYTTSRKCLEGQWRLTNPQLLSNVSRFQVSFGLANTTFDEGLVFSTKSKAVWHDVGRNMNAVLCLPRKQVLDLGFKYVMNVRAWISSERHTTFISDPITVDHTPPQVTRGGSVLESTVNCSVEVDYITTETHFTACWNGVFREQESDISRYDVWVGSTPEADDILQPNDAGLNTTFSVPTVGLQQGVRYYVTVRAVNSAGLMTTAVSDGVTVDATQPAPGVVFASRFYTDRHVQESATTLHASWYGFEDRHSGLTSYKVGLYDAEDPTSAVVPLTDAGISNKFTFDGLSLLHEHRYVAMVKARDAAGLESETVRSPPILVDTTPPEGVTCQRYQFYERRPLLYTKTPSFLHDTYIAEFHVERSARDELTKVVVSAAGLETGAEGYVAFQNLKMPLSFKYTTASNATAEHILIRPVRSGDNEMLTVVVEAETGANVSADLFKCSEATSSGDDFVTIRQMSEFQVSVCALIHDKESSIRTILAGVGSTPGGLQVQPFTRVGQSAHALLNVRLQHAMPLYATVLAENHAGQWSRFISQPITIDRTPPEITNFTVAVRYVDEGLTNRTEVWADAEWTAVDEESGVSTCLCHLEGQNAYDETTKETRFVTPGKCQWHLQHPQHRARISVTLSCVNEVVILPVSVDAIASPFEVSDPTVRSPNSSLEFCWLGVDDPTISQYQYRFLHESSPLGEWSPLDSYKASAVLEKGLHPLPAGNVTLQVRAVNARQMTSDVASSTVRLDNEKPALTGTEASSTLKNGELQLDWQGVFKVSRDVTFAVYAGTAEGYGDLVNHVITKETSFKGQLSVATLSSVFLTIQAVYANGQSEVYQREILLQSD
ncbi:hypothetical protein BaRGS_00038812, partial [Batillaria attramentaria]